MTAPAALHQYGYPRRLGPIVREIERRGGVPEQLGNRIVYRLAQFEFVIPIGGNISSRTFNQRRADLQRLLRKYDQLQDRERRRAKAAAAETAPAEIPEPPHEPESEPLALEPVVTAPEVLETPAPAAVDEEDEAWLEREIAREEAERAAAARDAVADAAPEARQHELVFDLVTRPAVHTVNGRPTRVHAERDLPCRRGCGQRFDWPAGRGAHERWCQGTAAPARERRPPAPANGRRPHARDLQVLAPPPPVAATGTARELVGQLRPRLTPADATLLDRLWELYANLETEVRLNRDRQAQLERALANAEPLIANAHAILGAAKVTRMDRLMA